ncbi:hypothetical protein Tco_1182649 [Tanacetum coccineum]
MEEFATEDQANYYSGIPSITVNGKSAYEINGKFLDDLRDNACCGTNGEDAIEHIEYFLKIVDPITCRMNGKACYNSDVHNKEKHEDEERCEDAAHDAPDYAGKKSTMLVEYL